MIYLCVRLYISCCGLFSIFTVFTVHLQHHSTSFSRYFSLPRSYYIPYVDLYAVVMVPAVIRAVCSEIALLLSLQECEGVCRDDQRGQTSPARTGTKHCKTCLATVSTALWCWIVSSVFIWTTLFEIILSFYYLVYVSICPVILAVFFKHLEIWIKIELNWRKDAG